LGRVAVIGGGISGMTAAWLLRKNHDVTLFEAGDYLGGHTHTHQVHADGAMWNVDTGFIVFNNKTYPNFTKLLGGLGIEARPTSMSFSVMSEKDDLEYNGTSINSLFAQRRNLFRPMFLRMIKGILDFNAACKELLKSSEKDETLGAFLERRRFPKELGTFYIKPMAAAVWSAGTKRIEDIPIYFLARFFDNHGFLNVNDRPQWYTVTGGSWAYAKKIHQDLGESVRMSSSCDQIKPTTNGVLIRVNGRDVLEFDHVIMACHSDEALGALAEPTNLEQEILGAITYAPNDILLHTDTRMMPRRKLAWAAWNYHLFDASSDDVAVTYNMNILQGHDCPTQFLVSLNCGRYVDPTKVIKTLRYQHPVFTTQAVAAQARHHEISGVRRIHYCGAYWANGFHEDGVVSALRVVAAVDPSIKLAADSSASAK
jgi:predicted NAD/FAD-binding protein